MSKSPFDHIKAIDEKTEYTFNPDESYSQYVINRGLSFNIDTIFFVHELNKYRRVRLSDKMHYDFLFFGIPKKKRYGKWIKQDKTERIDVICKYYECSIERAKEYLGILTGEQFIEIERLLNAVGGRTQYGKNT
jgi:hypothetical protein